MFIITTAFIALLFVAMFFCAEYSYETDLFLSSVLIFLPFFVGTMFVLLTRGVSSSAAFDPDGIG
jgi:hypothetical protein